MQYQQSIQPNLSIVGSEGLCLVYVREVFNIAAKYATAITAWDASSAANHPDETPPSNISVPLFFSCSNPDGHVCLWNQGTIHSTSAQGMQTFNSIQELINWMHEDFVYLGWSEELNGARIVEAVAEPTPPPDPTPEPTPQTYTVVKNINGYITSNDAANHIGVVVPVDAGEYSIFNEEHGMINITTNPKAPGSWINPNDNQVTDINPPAPAEPEVPEVAAPTTEPAAATTASDFEVTVPAATPPAATSDSEEVQVPVTVNKTPPAFETTYTAFLGPVKYIIRATTNVTDLTGEHPEQTLKQGVVKEIAGLFYKNGAEYLRTVASVEAGVWYGIPVTAMTKISKDMPDQDFDLMLDDIKNDALTELKAAKKSGWISRLHNELKKEKEKVTV